MLLKAFMLYDVFICHTSADKAAFVRPLVRALCGANVEVWYDARSLKLGDSIRRTIDKGLSKSRFAIVVLSKAFFARNWPQYELDGLAERELAGNDKVILPIWHGVTHRGLWNTHLHWRDGGPFPARRELAEWWTKYFRWSIRREARW